MKRYPEAERCYKEASQIFEAVFGKDNYDYILCEHELGVLAHDLGNKTEAESKYLEVKSLLEKSFGKENQPYVTNIQWLAGLYRETNRWEKVGQLVREAGQIQRRILLRSFSYFSESELASYLPLFSTYKDTRLDITWLNPLPELSEASFDDILFYKGFLLECATQMRRIASQADDSTQTLFKTWLACNRRLSSGEVFSDSEKQLVEEANSIERALTHHSAILGNNIRQVEWKEIRDKLQLSDAIVEFVHFEFNPIGDPSDSVLYAALVIRKNDPHPVFIRLFEEKQLDTLLLHKTTDSEQYVGLVYRNPKLYKLIWEPFDSLLDGVTRIYYSPSGLLHRVSLPAIAERADGPLLADRYSLQYVSSTRELVVGKEKLYGKDIQTGLVYGGIRYETDSIKMAGSLSKLDADFKKWSPDTVALPKMSTAHTDTLLQSWASILHRGSDERADPRYLPGSLREMEKTGRLFKSKSIRTMTLSEYEASEESFKRLGEDFPSPDVIHVSTHGFFFPDPVRRKEDADKPILFAGNPLFRSGLHFAGSIQAWRKNAPLKGFDDGILYAYEVSHLNLSNTKLVVLSACETGLGDIRGSEGVYGLQRAFRLAGAQHILMSLWKISDDATVDFMETFYLNWLSGKETDIREAFARTQKEMRKKYKDPYYWAAFVLI
ncbi:MAG: hypothetical protein EPGJADBJ_03965 [Saprospiraceae bacterium]|nr:hypothetical protein [Saprospiraceae bacterium]